MADGSITFNTALDNQGLERELKSTIKKIESLNNKIYQKKQKRSELVKQAEELTLQLDLAKKKLQDMKNTKSASSSISEQAEHVRLLQNEWNKVQNRVDRYNESIKNSEAVRDTAKEKAGDLSKKMSESEGSVKEAAGERFLGIMQKMRDVAASVSHGLRAIGKSAITAFKSGVKHAVSFIGKLNAFSKLSETLNGKFKRLGNTIKSALVFSVIYKGLGIVRRQIGEYLSVNAEFTAALSKIKGALLTAFQPIYDAVVPALTAFLNILSRVVSSMTSFTSALFGGTASEAQKNAKALYSQAKATKSAGKAADDASKSMAGFDEINQLSTNSGNGGSEAEAIDPSFSLKMDDTAFDTWGDAFNAMLDNLLAGIPKLENALHTMAGKINVVSKKLLEMFTFDGAQEKAAQLGTEIAAALNGMIADIDWYTLGQALGAGINTALGFLVAFIYTFDWMGLGACLAESFNGLLSQIDWVAMGQLLWSGFKIAIDTLAGFLLNVDMTQLAQSASQLIIGFFDAATDTIANIDWEEIGHQVKEFLVNVDWSGIATSVFTAIGAAFGALTAFLWGLIKDAWAEVVGWWYDVAYEDGQFTLQGLLNGILEVINNIGAWIDEYIFKPFMAGFKKVFGIHSPSTVMQEMGKYLVDGLYNGLKNIWKSIKKPFDDVYDGIKGIFDDTWSAVKGVINSIIGGVESLANGVVSGINTVIQALNGLSFDVPDWVPALGGKTFGFDIGEIPKITIPRLAQGAVIPPNREFLAVLGDQSSGTNIEAPLSTIEQAVRNVMSEMGGTGGELTLIVKPAPGFTRYVTFEVDREHSRRGVKLVEGMA